MTRINDRLRCRFGIIGLSILLSAGARDVRGDTIISLDFNQDGVLPSSQGMTFVGIPGSVNESGVYQASGGFLNIDSRFQSGDAQAYYQRLNAFDHNLATELMVRARVSAADQLGLGFTFYDSAFIGSFHIADGFWSMGGNITGPIPNPNDFHDFSFTVAPITGEFEFRIDGVLTRSGILEVWGGNESLLWFGDGTSTGGNVAGQIDYLIYRNTAPAQEVVPEPSSLALFAVVVAIFVAWEWRRRFLARWRPADIPAGAAG